MKKLSEKKKNENGQQTRTRHRNRFLIGSCWKHNGRLVCAMAGSRTGKATSISLPEGWSVKTRKRVKGQPVVEGTAGTLKPYKNRYRKLMDRDRRSRMSSTARCPTLAHGPRLPTERVRKSCGRPMKEGGAGKNICYEKEKLKSKTFRIAGLKAVEESGLGKLHIQTWLSGRCTRHQSNNPNRES